MANPLVPGVFELTTFGTLAGQPCDHVTHWYVGGLIASIDTVNIQFAHSDVNNWIPHMQNNLSPEYTHTSSRCVYLGDIVHAPQTAIAGGVGISAQPVSSFGTCVTIRHPVPVRGRGRQGRTNIPGPGSGDVDQVTGKLVPAFTASVLANWNAYVAQVVQDLTTFTPTPPVLTILSRKTGTIITPNQPFVDTYPNTHRRWQKRLSRHR